eukprot:824122-Amorphochlora_amoeboformis.AAC.1
MEEWTKRVIKEFWAQGDLERLHGLPVGPGRDRSTANVPLGQQFFIKVLANISAIFVFPGLSAARPSGSGPSLYM